MRWCLMKYGMKFDKLLDQNMSHSTVWQYVWRILREWEDSYDKIVQIIFGSAIGQKIIRECNTMTGKSQ